MSDLRPPSSGDGVPTPIADDGPPVTIDPSTPTPMPPAEELEDTDPDRDAALRRQN